MNISHNINTTLIYPVILLPPLLIFLFIKFYSINVPYLDQWDGFVNLLPSLNAGKLSIFDLWNQHNEHRIIFPKLIMIFLAHFSHYNVIWEQYFSLIIQCLTFFILLNLLNISFSFSSNHLKIFLLIMFSIFLFSMVQYENWSWGIQLLVFLNICAVIFSTYAFFKWPDSWIGIIFTAIGAIVAAYSFANGIIIFGIIFYYLLFNKKNTKTSFIIFWLIISLIICLSYFYKYEKPDYHPSLLSFIEHPLHFIFFIMAYIGSPLGIYFGLKGAVLFGFLGISIFIILLFLKFKFRHADNSLNISNPFFMPFIYVILTAIVTGIGRSGFGASQALYSRYTSFSVLFWIVLLTIAVSWIDENYNNLNYFKKKIILFITAIAFFSVIIFHSFSYAKGLNEFKNHYARLSQVYPLLKYRKFYGTPSEFSILFPSPPMLYKGIEILRNQKIGPFYKEIQNVDGIYITGSYLNSLMINQLKSRSDSDLLVLGKNGSLSVNFEIPEPGNYQISVKLGFTQNYGLSFFIVDKERIFGINHTKVSKIDSSQFFWVLLGNFKLSQGFHLLTVENKKGINLIKAISITK